MDVVPLGPVQPGSSLKTSIPVGSPLSLAPPLPLLAPLPLCKLCILTFLAHFYVILSLFYLTCIYIILYNQLFFYIIRDLLYIMAERDDNKSSDK